MDTVTLKPQLPLLRKVLNNIAWSVMWIGPTAAQMWEEVYSDQTMYCCGTLSFHDYFFGIKKRAFEATVLKDANISTRAIVQAFTLANDDEGFASSKCVR